ncbi:DoxX family protein [Nocardia sp. SYP-A9097]|uniref:DoxX family protein n=1 Tax=Nocardia sp. SYP-A9097 TaxID=2663237 RepID=UPI00129B9F5D|nr:DoxX family protein [Nocardia sp. SYP-A9097]MRH92733.1 DoxX family protein [Nocardia sp. SYP-A9097]
MNWIRYRPLVYWVSTGLVIAELVVGGVLDAVHFHTYRDLVVNLGYPTYFLTILGVWKIIGAAAILAPGWPVVKEWAYAGTFFVYTGAIISHLTTGYALNEVGVLAVFTVLTAASWALRPADRRVPRATLA